MLTRVAQRSSWIPPFLTSDRWSWCVLTVVVLSAQMPLLLSPSGTVLDSADFTKYFVPIHEFVRRSLLAGQWPLWSPYLYAGTPFAANPQTMVFYPLNLVLEARWLADLLRG